MNFSNSTTGKTERLKDQNSLAVQWKSFDWAKVGKEVNRLQTRIAKATVKGDKNKVKRLQYLLTHSLYAKAYAVKKVTSNKGKNTSGVDKKRWSTPTSKMKATLALTDKTINQNLLEESTSKRKEKTRNDRYASPPCMTELCRHCIH